MYQVAYSPGAIEDYERSVLWYTERSPQAARKFVAEVQNRLAIISRKPHLFANRYKHYYEATLSKYPFSIVFTVEETLGQILVIGIYHQKRNPKRKYRR